MNIFLHIAKLIEDSSEATSWLENAGFFEKYAHIIGFVLAFTGVGIIYFGVKSLQGFKIMPEREVVVVDKTEHYVQIGAKVVDKRSTKMPNFNGEGEIEFCEMEIMYTYNEKAFSHWIAFEESSGGRLEIMINPDNPQEFYIKAQAVTAQEVETDEGEDDVDEEKPSKMGVVMIIIGLLVGAIGVFIVVDHFIK